MTDPRDRYEADLAGFGVPTGPDADRGRDDLERLASKLAERVREGAAADVDGIAAGEDDLAARLRELAPVVEALERWKVFKEAECGADALPATLPFDRLDDCRFVREIGRGGNGVVFEAVQGLVYPRRVAVKVFPRRRAADGSEPHKRFLDEAATLSRLEHPHVVPIYSFGSDRGFFYYVMRLAEGGSLDRAIERLRAAGSSRTPAPDAARSSLRRDDWRAFALIGVQVADALAYAHGRGVIHGDVKPANVLLDEAGRAVVTDFGPSRPAPGVAGPLAGTYRYMAPERFDGTTDERTDVYSLGATLYELATLTPAFDGRDREEVVRAVLRHDVAAPRIVRPDVPADLDAVIVKAMHRDRAARYASASDLAADLRNFLRGRRVVARKREGVVARLTDLFRREA